jgi:alpha-beta hydrolase superfamily lysophospholipase
VHTEGRFVATNGLSLFEQTWSPAGEPRAVLVLVHGLEDHSDRYAAFAEDAARAGIRVRAFDLRGHGDSEGDRVYVDSFEEYLADLGAFLQEVRPEAPDTPLFLFGHSMGGAIVALYTIRHHPPVRGVILSAPALERGEDVSSIEATFARMFGSITPTLALLSLDDQKFSRDPRVVSAMQQDPLVYHGAGPARTAAELLHAIDEIDEHMEQMTTPFLVMHGTADGLTNPAGSRALHARAAVADKTILLYPGAYHDLLHEPEHARVEADVLGWILARSSRAAAPPAPAPTAAPAPPAAPAPAPATPAAPH